MKPSEIEVQRCIECPLFHYEHSINFPRIPHCNFYKSLGWKLSFRAEEEKHPRCKVVSIVVDEKELSRMCIKLPVFARRQLLDGVLRSNYTLMNGYGMGAPAFFSQVLLRE